MKRYTAVVLLLPILAPPHAGAARITVPDGTPLQIAVDAAAPGDTLVLETGLFPGPVVIDKSLRIVCNGGAAIDPPPGTPIGVDIAADDVTIAARVGASIGMGRCATQVGLRVHGRRRVRVKGVHMGCLFDTAVGLDLMNVSDSSFRRIIASGVIGIHVRQLGVRSHVSIDDAEAKGGTDGALFEDIAPGGQRGAGVKMRRTIALNGLRLVNADGSMIIRSFTDELELDAGSDNNFVRASGVETITDAGSGNCFLKNEGHPDSCP